MSQIFQERVVNDSDENNPLSLWERVRVRAFSMWGRSLFITPHTANDTTGFIPVEP